MRTTIALAVALALTSAAASLPRRPAGDAGSGASLAGQARPAPPDRFNDYLHAIATLRARQPAAAVDEVIGWSERDVAVARTALVTRAGRDGLSLADRGGPGTLDTAVFIGAILLHLETAFRAWSETGDTLASGLHWNSARSLTQDLAGWTSARPDAFAKSIAREAPVLIFVLMSEFALRAWLLDVAEDAAGQALGCAARDPAALFVSAAVAEAMAFNLANEAKTARFEVGNRPGTEVPRWVSEAKAHAGRQKAAGLYRQVLALRPGDTAARLRLARVEMLEEHEGVATEQLRAVLESGSEDERYLALLFQGAIEEGADRLPPAIARYREAVALRPQAQTARVALAYALERSGRIDEVAGLLRVSAAVPAPRPVSDDPWWTYPFGGVERIDPLRQHLVALVAAP